jgi:O-antigen biosynthesis protein
MIKKIFHKLPLPLAFKRSVKNLIFVVFQKFLRDTRAYQNYLYEKDLRHSTSKAKKVAKSSWVRQDNIIKNIEETKIKFIASREPKVSIIIPVHNKVEFTFNCLKSIYENTNDEDYEVIVVDDCSTDNTPMVLSKIKNICVLRNNTNQGFLNSCNTAAESARGEYLVFLNNDTLVTEGWLTWLIKTFDNFPDAGLVGSKLIFPDGRLQEAGSIVWKDGTAHNYGRLNDPSRPEYNYVREVDYCSGACITIPQKLFMSLGMFDVRYSPAYYEDVDLAFKVRTNGKKVLYQPNSEVFHFEGITSGKDTSCGIKKYQMINRIKFFNKWKDVLAKHARSGEAIEFEKERNIKKRILVIDECICLPDQDAGSLRMLNMLQIIRDMGYKISFFPNNRYYPTPYVRDMQGMGIEILFHSYMGTVKKYLKRTGASFDSVILSRLNVADAYMDIVKQYCCNAKIIFDTVDLNFLREQRQARLKNDDALIRQAEKTKSFELAIASRADVTLVVSPEEKKIIEKENPEICVKIVTTIHQVRSSSKRFSQRNDLLFIGGFRHLPNVDAMIYFVKEVFPFISKQLPGIKTFIVGSHPPPEIAALASNDIIITGFVKDIEPYINNCRVAIAPLRYGAGVKGKINLSMSYGLPVVTTRIGIEGMYLEEGKDVLIAENAPDFADAVINLYTNGDLWNKLSANGLENVKNHFSFAAAEKSLISVLDGDYDPIVESRKAFFGR